MTNNKATVERYMDGFRRSDHAAILACLTDDVERLIPGAFEIRGKTAFDTHIEDEGFIGPPEIAVARLVEEGDVVVAEGSVRTRRATARPRAWCSATCSRSPTAISRRLTSYLMETR